MSALVAEQSNTKIAWESRKLSEVASVVNGGTPKSKVAEFWNGPHQWLTPADMGKMEGREIGVTPRTITEQGLAKSSAKMVPPKSVILSTRAPIGHLAINAVPMAFNQGCRGLVPSDNLDHVFLHYFLQANRDLLNDLGTGATFKELSATNLKSVEIPLPPLEEQKRIVAVLDQAFAALDRARANAEANLADAEELFEVGLDNLISKHSNDADRTNLGAICTFENGDRGKNYPGRKASVPVGIPFINAGHLEDGAIEWDAMNYIPEEHFHRLAKGKVRPDDLLFCLRGSLGKFGKVDREGLGAIASSLVIVRAMGDVLTDFLSIYFRSKTCKLMIEDYAGGAAQPNLSAGDLKKFKIALPSLAAQQQAIGEYGALADARSRLVSAYIEDLSDLEDLRQSILQKAFAGELT